MYFRKEPVTVKSLFWICSSTNDW